MLPLNDSISLSINDVCAKTTVRIGPSVKKDSVSINGSNMCLLKHPGFLRCFKVRLFIFVLVIVHSVLKYFYYESKQRNPI